MKVTSLISMRWRPVDKAEWKCHLHSVPKSIFRSKFSPGQVPIFRLILIRRNIMTKEQLTRTSQIAYRSFRSLLEENASRFPKKPFIESIDAKKAITYDQTYRVCNQIGQFLKDKGIRANDRIVLLSNNSLENLILFLGIWSYGATFCPINVEINEKIIPDLITKIQPKIVVWDHALGTLEPDKDSRWEWIPLGNWNLEDKGRNGEKQLFRRILQYPEIPPGPSVCKEEDFSLIIHTSGTTSQPKGVMVTYGASFCSAEATALALGMTEEDKILEYRPLSWGSAQSLGLMGPLYAGATAVIAKRFSRSRFFDWLKDYRITIAVGIPAAINMLLAEQVPIHKADLPDLRFITSSTAPLTPEQHVKFEEIYGIKIIQLYGMSEAGWMTANHPDNRKIGSVGRATRHQEVKIVDDDGNACPSGTIGEIEVNGGQRAYGYLEEGSAMVPFGDKGLKTGDIGFLDEQGFLYITGRKKDLIIRGGVNIAPMEIDNVLLQHPDVADAATVGVPDAIYGQGIVCYVACKPGKNFTKESILSHCRVKLPDYKMPQEIVFLDSIPKTEVEKVDRNLLLEQWMRHHTAG